MGELSRYQILDEIGFGHATRVVKAYDTKLKRHVALKLLTAADEESRYRFRRAARLLSRLNHPNVLAMYDYSDADAKTAFIANELIAGPSLRTVLDRNAAGLETMDALGIARDIALALEHAHSRDVVHRDVKPENIFCTNDGRVLLADFGLAKSLSSVTEHQTTLHGSLAYMAPEQFSGKPANPRSDVYALGVVLFEMLTGERPYDSKNIDDLISIIESGKRRPFPQGKLSLPLERFVDQLLAVVPSKRPANARIVAERLRQLAQPELADFDPERARVTRRRARLLLVCAGVAVALGLMVAGLWALFG